MKGWTAPSLFIEFPDPWNGKKKRSTLVGKRQIFKGPSRVVATRSPRSLRSQTIPETPRWPLGRPFGFD